VLVVPAAEVVELVDAAACDHLYGSVRCLLELGEGRDTADSAIVSRRPLVRSVYLRFWDFEELHANQRSWIED
jgi:hypothetical protein